MSTAELASSYAALILADDGVEITVSFIPDVHVSGRPRLAARPWEDDWDTWRGNEEQWMGNSIEKGNSLTCIG